MRRSQCGRQIRETIMAHLNRCKGSFKPTELETLSSAPGRASNNVVQRQLQAYGIGDVLVEQRLKLKHGGCKGSFKPTELETTAVITWSPPAGRGAKAASSLRNWRHRIGATRRFPDLRAKAASSLRNWRPGMSDGPRQGLWLCKGSFKPTELETGEPRQRRKGSSMPTEIETPTAAATNEIPPPPHSYPTRPAGTLHRYRGRNSNGGSDSMDVSRYQTHRLESGELVRIPSRRQRREQWRARRRGVVGETRRDRTDAWRASWEALRGDL